jgi:hypothetical protein
VTAGRLEHPARLLLVAACGSGAPTSLQRCLHMPKGLPACDGQPTQGRQSAKIPVMEDRRAEAAKAIIAAYTGERVVTYDDQSKPSMHDLEIHYADGHWAAVEVTASEDQQRVGDFAALHKQPVIQDHRLRQGWLVLLKPGALVNRARAGLSDILVQFEDAGFTEVNVHEHDAAEWACELLQSVDADIARSGIMKPGVIGLTGSMRVEWLSSDPEDVVTFVERFAASRPDNLSKLRNSGAPERHLFVWGGAFPQDWASLRPLGVDIPALPSRAPNLPPEVTHVWVAADGERPSRIVHWTPDGSWQEAGRIE